MNSDTIDATGQQNFQTGCSQLSSQRIEATQYIRESLVRHTAPPVGLGSQCAGVSRELRALCHQLYLENHGPDGLRAFAKGVVQIATDWGSEAGLCDVPQFSIEQLIPHLLDVESDDGGPVSGDVQGLVPYLAD